jgi:hypothetical protein
LVKAWVNQYLHFGNTTTSRVEVIYAVLKEYLKRLDLNIFEVWKTIKLALFNQLTELKSNQAKQQIRTPLELSRALYSSVYGWVSYEALRKVDEQRRLLVNKLPPYTGSFTRSFGLPCAHLLKDLLEQDKPFQLQHFHSQWHIQRTDTPQFLLEPRQRIDPIATKST